MQGTLPEKSLPALRLLARLTDKGVGLVGIASPSLRDATEQADTNEASPFCRSPRSALFQTNDAPFAQVCTFNRTNHYRQLLKTFRALVRLDPSRSDTQLYVGVKRVRNCDYSLRSQYKNLITININ